MNEILKTEVVANDVATERKKYVSPEIEVFDLDNHAPLLAASYGNGAGFNPIDRDIDD